VCCSLCGCRLALATHPSHIPHLASCGRRAARHRAIELHRRGRCDRRGQRPSSRRRQCISECGGAHEHSSVSPSSCNLELVYPVATNCGTQHLLIRTKTQDFGLVADVSGLKTPVEVCRPPVAVWWLMCLTGLKTSSRYCFLATLFSQLPAMLL
jgi:hypothetical protein